MFRQGKALVPSFTAFAVTRLLRDHFADFVDIGFTAEMEKDLDEISNGERPWVEFIRDLSSGAFAARTLGAMDGLDDRVLCGKLVDDFTRAVFRSIVDRQYLQPVPVVIAIHKGLEDMGRHLLLVVHGHQYCDRRMRESHQFHHVL